MTALVCLSALAVPARALAEPPPPKFPEFFVEEEPRTPTLALELNPLGVAIGRFSGNLEFLIATHHAAVLSPHYYYAYPGQDDQLTGGGVELGYRYYTGKYGPHGWFFGASFLYGQYTYVHTSANLVQGTCVAFVARADCPDNTTYDAYGGALDVGYQLLLRQHLVVGAGLGVQYVAFSQQPTFETQSNSHQDLLYGSGLRPRFLLEIGGRFRARSGISSSRWGRAPPTMR